MNNTTHYNKLKIFDMEQISDYGFFCDIEEPYTNDNNKKLIIKNNRIYKNKLYSICENNNIKNSDFNLNNLSNTIDDEINEIRKKLALVVGIFCVSIYIIMIVV